MATLEEACECPKCHNQMQRETYSRDDIKKRIIYVATCMTEGCSWFGTGRSIQVDNGIVFERQVGPRGHDKTFETLTNDQLAMGQRMVEDAVGRDLGSEGRPE